MKFTKKQLKGLIEQAAQQTVLNQLLEAQLFVDPVFRAFDDMLVSIEKVGSMINVDDPAYQEIENILMAAEDVYDSYVGEG